jgi:hypothetical protein
LTLEARSVTLASRLREEGVALDKALLIQLLGSAVAVSLLIAIAAWARIARPTPPLDAERARALLTQEFPDDPIDALWIAADGAGLVARSGDRAAMAAKVENGRLRLKLADGAPRLVLNGAAWPPSEFEIAA